MQAINQTIHHHTIKNTSCNSTTKKSYHFFQNFSIPYHIAVKNPFSICKICKQNSNKPCHNRAWQRAHYKQMSTNPIGYYIHECCAYPKKQVWYHIFIFFIQFSHLVHTFLQHLEITKGTPSNSNYFGNIDRIYTTLSRFE